MQLHISEKSGRGVPKIIETYGKETFEFRENSIVVTIPFNRLDLGSNTQVTTQVDTIGEMDDISKKILSFCTEPKSSKEITEYLGLNERKSTSRYLRINIRNE